MYMYLYIGFIWRHIHLDFRSTYDKHIFLIGIYMLCWVLFISIRQSFAAQCFWVTYIFRQYYDRPLLYYYQLAPIFLLWSGPSPCLSWCHHFIIIQFILLFFCLPSFCKYFFLYPFGIFHFTKASQFPFFTLIIWFRLFLYGVICSF